MLRLATTKATPGMVLALPVLHPDKPDHLLLRPGVRLDGEIIGKLREMKVPRLWITYPPTDFLLKYASAAILAEHGRIAARVGEAFDAVTNGCHANLDFHVYTDAVRSLVEKLLNDPQAAIFVEGLLDTTQPLMAHSANVCLLSLLMGLKLDGYLISERKAVSPRRAQNVENLGVGALLHDIGMLRIDPAAAEKWYRDFDEHDISWRRHTLAGFEVVRGKIAATAAAVVLHHHQRMDGAGFPRRAKLWAAPRALMGHEIHIFSRIVAVADTFDRVRQSGIARAARASDLVLASAACPSVRALNAVLTEVRAGRLDANVFRALVSVAPAYPPGAIVELNDGRSCVVTGWNPVYPCSPTVRPLLPADAHTGEHALGPTLDLTKQSSLAVVSMDGERTAGDNFHPRTPGEFDLRLLSGGITLDEDGESVHGRAWPQEARGVAA